MDTRNPKEKNDALAQTRCNRKTLATILKFFVEQDRRPRSQYELVRWALEEYARILTENDLVDEVAFTSDAQNLLTTFNMDFGCSGRMDKAFYHNLAHESLKLEKVTLHEPMKQSVTEDIKEQLKSVPRGIVAEEDKDDSPR